MKAQQTKEIIIKIQTILCLWKNVFIFVFFLNKFIKNQITKNNGVDNSKNKNIIGNCNLLPK